jgi:hypothetical protein
MKINTKPKKTSDANWKYEMANEKIKKKTKGAFGSSHLGELKST